MSSQKPTDFDTYPSGCNKIDHLAFSDTPHCRSLVALSSFAFAGLPCLATNDIDWGVYPLYRDILLYPVVQMTGHIYDKHARGEIGYNGGFTSTSSSSSSPSTRQPSPDNPQAVLPERPRVTESKTNQSSPHLRSASPSLSPSPSRATRSRPREDRGSFSSVKEDDCGTWSLASVINFLRGFSYSDLLLTPDLPRRNCPVFRSLESLFLRTR